MSAFLMIWNPTVWNGTITNPCNWTCGNTNKIKAGDRLFLIRLGIEPRGIVAACRARTGVFVDTDGERVVSMSIDTLLDPECEELFALGKLVALNADVPHAMNWSARTSGLQIPELVEIKLEVAWREFLDGRLSPADEVRQAFVYHEGAVRQITINAYERNPEARKACIAHHGKSCCVCGADFGQLYGLFADGYIHVHHLKPLSEIGGEYLVDPVRDLRPVCPNCHAVLHLGGVLRSVEELKAILQEKR